MSIRKFICFLFLLVSIISTNAQKNYTITYSRYSDADITNGKLNYTYRGHLSMHIYDDTLSFSRYWSHKPKMSKKVSVLSSDSHHGTLHHLTSDSILEVSTFTDDKYLIKVCKPFNWKILTDTVTILGIKCIKAESALGVTAWFAPSKPINAGPSFYYGLPGLILQVYEKQRNSLFVADSIQNEVPPLVYPENIKIIRVGKPTITLQN